MQSSKSMTELTSDSPSTAILLLSCPDRRGLISRISHFVFERNGNILDLDEHVDGTTFFLRIAWDMKNFTVPEPEVKSAFTPLAKEFHATWQISFTGRKERVAIFVSKYDHCLQEILWRKSIGEYDVEILHGLLGKFNAFHDEKHPLRVSCNQEPPNQRGTK